MKSIIAVLSAAAALSTAGFAGTVAGDCGRTRIHREEADKIPVARSVRRARGRKVGPMPEFLSSGIFGTSAAR
jgi:hypothetical protein